MVVAGAFRRDLYYRLDIVEIALPSLRERVDDLPLLCRHFFDRLNRKLGKSLRGLSREAQLRLRGYAWPGNVRELENVLERAFLQATRDFVHVSDLSPVLQAQTETEPAAAPAPPLASASVPPPLRARSVPPPGARSVAPPGATSVPPPRAASVPPPPLPEPSTTDLTLATLERAHIERVLQKNGGHRLATARDLGISRSTLYEKLARYGLR
jgi:two-component system response regulator PilR (NtrC family)